MTLIKSCVHPSGTFTWGVHRPRFRAQNMRVSDDIPGIGRLGDGSAVKSRANFPPGPVDEPEGSVILETPNAFPFRGTSYVIRSAADEKAKDPGAIRIEAPSPGPSTLEILRKWTREKGMDDREARRLFLDMPEPLLLAAAATSRDPDELTLLARRACGMVFDPRTGRPTGLEFEEQGRPRIRRGDLFETVSNNPFLPDDYKWAMVLNPGVQGGSEIVGEYSDKTGKSHVLEYLRRNSYIPWGHYAANMARDSVRYRARDLSLADVSGMRTLYCQRTYLRVAEEWGIDPPAVRRLLSEDEIESLRLRILDAMRADGGRRPGFDRTLWGWNLGFDFSPSGYRLHASHQQIHQQFALVPSRIESSMEGEGNFSPYAWGDLIADFSRDYEKAHGRDFFGAFLQAVSENRRADGRGDLPDRLAAWEDGEAILFAPKAQTSQWELLLMAKKPAGNILEAGPETRRSLDRGILMAARALSGLGASMITVSEASKPFGAPDKTQRLMYSFFPRLPWSPGAFSEGQLRWISGHYPEDFAAACRMALDRETGDGHSKTNGLKKNG
ncbi:conserved hypothetical protein [Candidatus Desulfarcum epimagneticum]|uniref:Uncharacterized protein n=1 Tax=uncultured Desulfobacteraceae bacterium TaxID=218296 RepID=A0A484HEZ7_9BACT|nr:conserved hypothetical protein [uncultured Desulfobacteraceae bacterium]